MIYTLKNESELNSLENSLLEKFGKLVVIEKELKMF